jgi:selenide,water dikinase
MKQDQTPILKDLVLVGGGHAHITVLKKFGMNPIPGVRVTLICRDLQAPYSGMLPGFIAGHYTFDEAHIDLGPLARFAGARFYHDEVIGLDTHNKKLICKNRPDVPYDLMSVNIGSAPNTAIVPGATDNVTPVKPIDGFVNNWDRMCERIVQHTGAVKIGIVGAGAGGVELTLSVQYRLQKMLSDVKLDNIRLEFHLFTDKNDILVTHNRFVRNKFHRVLDARGIHTHLNHEVSSVRDGGLQCGNGEYYELDEILWVTMASAQAWLGEAGLDVDDEGFVKVNDTLESISHPGIFAAGDVAHVLKHPRPKSGVFAVRQGPPLSGNLRRFLLGKPLKSFTPQKQFLSLISTGDKYAIASRSWWALEGRWVWTCVVAAVAQRWVRQFWKMHSRNLNRCLEVMSSSACMIPMTRPSSMFPKGR